MSNSRYCIRCKKSWEYDGEYLAQVCGDCVEDVRYSIEVLNQEKVKREIKA